MIVRHEAGNAGNVHQMLIVKVFGNAIVPPRAAQLIKHIHKKSGCIVLVHPLLLPGNIPNNLLIAKKA